MSVIIVIKNSVLAFLEKSPVYECEIISLKFNCRTQEVSDVCATMNKNVKFIDVGADKQHPSKAVVLNRWPMVRFWPMSHISVDPDQNTQLEGHLCTLAFGAVHLAWLASSRNLNWG